MPEHLQRLERGDVVVLQAVNGTNFTYGVGEVVHHKDHVSFQIVECCRGLLGVIYGWVEAYSDGHCTERHTSRHPRFTYQFRFQLMNVIAGKLTELQQHQADYYEAQGDFIRENLS
jgi:uncharacterized membrane protein YsdA (DUF1294 family)